MIRSPKRLRTITHLWAVFAAASIALAAFGLDDAAQDVAGRVVNDAYNGNPLAIGVLIALLLLGGALWVGERLIGAVAKWRGMGSPAPLGLDPAEVRDHLKVIAASIGALETSTAAGQAELKAEIKGLRRDVDRLDRERIDG